MQVRTLAAGFLSSLILGFLATCAQALDVISPADGDTVSSRPTFTLDQELVNGDATVEFSKSPDTQAAGRNAGRFVDMYTDALLPFTETSPTASTLRFRLDAGFWYWHYQIDSYGRFPEADGVWSPVRRFEVEDDPPILTGWTARATALKKKRCKRARVRGTIGVEDNDRDPAGIVTVRVRSNGKTTRAFFDQEWTKVPYSLVACASRKATVTVFVEDAAGQRSTVQSRTVRIGS